MKDVKFSKKLKIISIALIVALVFQVVPLGAFATNPQENNYISTSQNLETERIAEVLYEDESRREETVKHFKMDDGTYSAVEYSTPVHYVDGKGKLKDIDNSLETITLSDGTSAYINKDNSFSVTLPDDLSNNREIVISKNGKKISFAVDGASNSNGSINNNTDAKKAEKLQKELEKATTEKEKAEIRNKYAYSVEKTESTLTYAYNGYIDVEYKLVGNKLKESLIIKKQTGKADFKFKYDFDGMTAELQPNNSVLVKDGDEVVFVIEAPYMFDSAENYSNAITVEIKNKNKGFEYILHVDKDWLKSSDRVYPVTVDPTISGSYMDSSNGIKSASGAESGLDASDEATMAQYNTTLKIGYVYGANVKSLYYAPIPSSIPKSARITGAYLYITAYRTPTRQFPVYLSPATKSWSYTDTSLAGTSQMPTFSEYEYYYYDSLVAGQAYAFEITNLVQSWHSGESNNYGVVLHTDAAGTSSENFGAFYSTYATSNKPYYVYSYTDTKGVEGYWSYSTVGLPKGGSASINQFTGYVSAEIPLLSTESALLPYGLSLIYDGYSANTNTYSLSTCGLGMKLSIDQRIVPIDTNTPEYAAKYYYMYRDADGTDIYLKRSYEGSVSHDKDELGYGYDATITNGWNLKDRSDNVIKFSSAGCITSMYSAEADASVTVTYDPGQQYRIHKITDGTGNNITITRNSAWYVTNITDDYGRYVNFTYDSGNHLTTLTYYDGTVVNFTYDADGMLTSVSGSDNTGIRFDYFDYPSTSKEYYLTNRVKEVSEFYKENGTENKGNSIGFKYNSGNSTTITDKINTPDDTSDDIATTYVFDNWGRVTSTFNDYGSAITDYMSSPSNSTTDSSTAKIHQVYKSASVEKPVNNLLKNHSFENGTTGWTAMTGVTAVTDNRYIGYKGIKIVGSTSEFRRALQNVTITESGTYTLSAYVKVTAPSGNNKVQLIIYESGKPEVRTRITDTAGEWQRIELTTTLDASKTHIVALGIDGAAATAYFDCVQLEKGDTANTYNLVENSTFKNNAEGWDTQYVKSGSGSVTYTDTADNRPEFITEGYRMYGNYNNHYSVNQSIWINKPAKDVAIDLSAYARAISAPNEGLFTLCIKFAYGDANGNKTAEELQFVTFNAYSTSWQRTMKPFVPTATYSNPEANYYVTYICVYFQYYDNLNYAEVANIMVNIDTTGKIYDYDENGNVIAISSLKDGKVNTNAFSSANELTESRSDADGIWKYNYKTDNEHILDNVVQKDLDLKVQYSYNNNILTGTTLSSTKSGGTNKTISSSTAYTSDNNRVQSMTDAAGNTVTYTYDSMGRTSTVTSGNSKTTYTYYAGTDRVQTVTSDTSANSSAAVTYTYDTAGRLTEIHRGNTVYTIVYDEWGNQQAVKVGNTALSTNTYEQGNGNLTNTTYGNGTSVDFIYDKLDRLTSKKINGVNQFTQIFNNTGAISKYNDLVTGVSWKYSYDLIGRLADITGSNGNRYYYIYDSENRISELKYIIGGATRSTNYTYNVLGIPNTVSFAGNIISNSYDDLGRLYKESLATDGGTVFDTTYAYVDISDTATTNMLWKMSSVFDTFTNTYDNLGNIIRVDEDWGKKADTYVEYTYDSLGQLISESGSRGTYTVTYDDRGNILTKGNNTYTYGNSQWQDLLTAYNGTNITYDAIGNPNNWRDGMTFSWQKGKQLASVVKNGTTYSYAYDSTGIRTSKTVNGITTTFTYVDGKLVHQTDGTNVWFFYYDATDKLIAMEYNGEQYYYLYDSTGNIVGLMTYDALTVADYEYDAWGKLISATGDMANINPIRYKGYYYDQELGLYYLQSRYYDPEIGRFINADEFTSTGQGVVGNNMFAYCGNNPVSREDNQGTFWDTVFDVISLVTSIVDVVRDPTDGWAWAGLAGDILDLIPFVTCVGEAVKVARVASKAVDVVDTAYDTVKTVDKIGDAVDTVGDTAKSFEKIATSGSPNTIGKIGEQLAGIDQGAKVSIFVNGRTRIPDALTETVLTEVKNVKYISNTRQLKDFSDFALATGRTMDLYVRPTTRIARTVIDAGWNIKYLW